MILSAFKFQSSGKGLPRWTGWIPLALGLLFLLSAAYYEYRYVLLGQRATGEVTNLERIRKTIYATVSYPTGSGEMAEFRQSVSMRERFTVGTRVAVRYLSGNTQLGRIESFYQLWFPALVKSLCALALCACGASLLRGRFFGLTRPAGA